MIQFSIHLFQPNRSEIRNCQRNVNSHVKSHIFYYFFLLRKVPCPVRQNLKFFFFWSYAQCIVLKIIESWVDSAVPESIWGLVRIGLRDSGESQAISSSQHGADSGGTTLSVLKIKTPFHPFCCCKRLGEGSLKGLESKTTRFCDKKFFWKNQDQVRSNLGHYSHQEDDRFLWWVFCFSFFFFIWN